MPLSEVAELDTMVTMVDAANFMEDLRLGKDQHSIEQAATDDDIRTVADWFFKLELTGAMFTLALSMAPTQR